MAIQNSLYGKDLSEQEANAGYLSTSMLNVPNGVPTLDSNSKILPIQIPAIITTVGFGGEVISVPYTGTDITLPLSIANGGTGTTNSVSALSALGAQPTYPILNSLHSVAGVGLVVKNDLGLVGIRSLQVNNPLTIINPSGGTGNPTISLNQGEGSGLNADLLDGLHASTFLRTDGAVTHTTGTASTIRTSILSAGSGANTDITSLGSITGLGNTANNQIQITSTGGVGIGDTPTPYGRAAIRGGVAGTANSSLALLTPNGVGSSRSNLAFYSTFGSGLDTNARRSADIVAGYNAGMWGSEYLSLNVGGATDNKLVATERMRIDGTGSVLIGKTTNTIYGGDLQVSRGLTFPNVQSPCGDGNTLDDYSEGTWVPYIESSSMGTGRVTNIIQASYVKIGRLVTVQAYFQLSTLGTGGSGYTIFAGLPYANGNTYATTTVAYFAGLKSPVITLCGSIPHGAAYVAVYAATATPGTGTGLLDFHTYIQVFSVFIISAQYIAAS